MPRKYKFVIAFIVIAIVFGSCEKQEKEEAPELPPYESMVIDFNKLSNTQKSALEETSLNYSVAGLTVGVWNLMIGATMIVPTTAFFHSFSHEANFIGDATWQWTYDLHVLGAKYTARMTGKVRTDDVKWDMYISRAGIGAFGEFKWFEGSSNLDGNGGQWTLIHSYEVQEAVLQIDWERENDDIAAVTYTYIRESDNGDVNQLAKNSFLSYGLKEDVYNAFYNIQYVSRKDLAEGFLNVNIQWSTTEFFGRIKAPHYSWPADKDDWHCWDENGFDMVCN